MKIFLKNWDLGRELRNAGQCVNNSLKQKELNQYKINLYAFSCYIHNSVL